MYSIKQMSKHESELLIEHLCRLDPQSCYDRFCTVTNKEFISRYVQQINFSHNGIFGIFDKDNHVIGMGECVIYQDISGEAEVAFSIEKEHQGLGLGNRLMKKLIEYAQEKKIQKMNMYCLRNNTKSVHLARKYGLSHSYDRDYLSTIIALPGSSTVIHSEPVIAKNGSRLGKIKHAKLIKKTFSNKI